MNGDKGETLHIRPEELLRRATEVKGLPIEMLMNAATPSGAIRALADASPIKAWSWLMTIFGDLAAEPGAEIGGAVLGALTEGIGIRPETTRVALHRLKKDGWITSRRVGRSSLHALSEHGRVETLNAARRIYAPVLAVPVSWHLMIHDPAKPVSEHPDALTIAPHVTLIPDHVTEQGTALTVAVDAADLPDWVRRAGIPGAVEADYATLAAILTHIEGMAALPSTPLDETLLRLLTLHHWRRALLRHGNAVEQLGGPDWIGAHCRRRSHALLDRLERPSPEMLAQN